MSRFDPEKHHRRSIRLPGYDYAQPGAYFVTICTRRREGLLGAIVNGTVQPNEAGTMVGHWWRELDSRFPTIETDIAVVMPNHFHGIIIVGAALGGRPGRAALAGHTAYNPSAGSQSRHPGGGAPTVGDVLDWFKTMTTNAYIRGVKALGWPPFQRRLWQRNYYEHIIRCAEELERVRAYIADNPSAWGTDPENPGTPPVSYRELWQV